MTISFTLVFIKPDGSPLEVPAKCGESVLEIGQRNGIDLEGSCEGCMSCSTCHVIIDADWYDKLPSSTEEEEDILDLAVGLSRTSRLGCQITMTADLDGLIVHVPTDTGSQLY